MIFNVEFLLYVRNLTSVNSRAPTFLEASSNSQRGYLVLLCGMGAKGGKSILGVFSLATLASTHTSLSCLGYSSPATLAIAGSSSSQTQRLSRFVGFSEPHVHSS